MRRAGQAGEVGSVFRCAVATHLAVHALHSRSVSGLDLPDGVDPVRLDFETDDPTDGRACGEVMAGPAAVVRFW